MEMRRTIGSKSTARVLIAVVAWMTAAVAWPAVVVHELPPAEQPLDSISEGNFPSGRIGQIPPKPWRCSRNGEKVRVTVETPAGRPESERWVRLVDDDDKEGASFRQSFAGLTNGLFQARLISNKDGGRLFFNFGSGTAAKPEDRAFQLNIESDGSLVVRGERKAKTSLQIKTGEVYLVRCEFEPVKDGKALRVQAELLEESTQHQSHAETEVETQVPITVVRITSIRADTGVDYYVTGVSLTSR
jgi:hypothetical protein